MSTVTVAFFSTLGAVINNLVDMFPEDTDFATLKLFIGLIQKTNPTIVINGFYEKVVSNYEKHIDDRNEQFILDYVCTKDDDSDIISKIQMYWAVFDDQTKDSIWQYLHILKELCKRAYTKTE
jgi:hypothetical protein